MAGPSVKIKVGADLSPAQKEVDAFQDATATAAKATGETLSASVEKGAQIAARSLGGVENAIERTAKAADGLDLAQAFDQAVGRMGNLHSALEQTDADLLDFKAGTTAAIVSLGDLASRTAQEIDALKLAPELTIDADQAKIEIAKKIDVLVQAADAQFRLTPELNTAAVTAGFASMEEGAKKAASGLKSAEESATRAAKALSSLKLSQTITVSTSIDVDTSEADEAIAKWAEKTELPPIIPTVDTSQALSDFGALRESPEALALGLYLPPITPTVDAAPAVEALGEIDEATERTADAVEGIQIAQAMETAVGHIGDVKDILEKTGATLFGFNQQTINTIVSVGDLAEKGASLGSAFGPWGALAGAAAGAIAGYFTAAGKEAAASKEAAKKTAEELANVQAETRSATEEFRGLGATNLSGLISQVATLQASLDKAKGFKGAIQDDIDKLAKEGTEGLIKAFDRLAGAAVGDEFRTQGKSLEELNALYEQSKKSVEALATESTGLAKDLANASKLTAASASDVNVSFEKDLNRLTAQIEAANTESAAYKAAIDALTPSIETNTKATQSNAKATKEATEEVDEFAASIARFDAQWEANLIETRKQELALLDYVDATVAARAALAAFNDEVLKSLEADIGGAALPEKKTVEVEVEIDPSAYDAALDKVEDFASTSKKLFNTASKDFKEAGRAFLTDALAASLSKVAENVEKGERAYKGLGAAVGEAAQLQIQALGKTWAFKAGGEAAEAIANLAFGNIPGAALHGQAALMFGALALAAGVGGGLLGRALPESTASGAATPATATGSSGASSGGSTFAGGSAFQELAPVQYNLAPGGTVVFSGDNRGKAQFGRFSSESQKAGRSGVPSLRIK